MRLVSRRGFLKAALATTAVAAVTPKALEALAASTHEAVMAAEPVVATKSVFMLRVSEELLADEGFDTYAYMASELRRRHDGFGGGVV